MSREPRIKHYLLVFDHDAGQLTEVVDFGGDSVRAIEEYGSRERELAMSGTAGRRIEIVLVGSDSLDTIRKTHANYFAPIVPTLRHLDLSGVA